MPKLLIVDDEPLIRKGLIKMLERISPEDQCEECESGIDAVEKIRNSEPDLIFSDIRMPVMDGLEMLEYLHDQGYRIPIVFITGYDDFAYIQKALRYRAYDYLLKPIQDEEVLKVLNRLKKHFPSQPKTGLDKHSAKVQHFEFQLLNALETFDTKRAVTALREGWQSLEEYFSFAAFMQEAVKVIDGFFTRNGFEAYPWFDGQPDLFLDLETLQLILDRRMQQLNRQPAYSDHIVEKAKEYIRRHINRAVTLSEVAEVVRLNMTYFSEYFKDKTGENFTQYVSRVRVEEAKRLLLDPSLKIIEIAEMMGYQNPRYFSKFFKNIVGVTPKEYREGHHIFE